MSVGKFALANPIIKLLASLCLSFRQKKKPKLISNLSILGASGYLAACLKYTSFSSAYSSLPQFLCNYQYWYFSDFNKNYICYLSAKHREGEGSQFTYTIAVT